jgi:tripartite-type tricarboxylate transporter receptor subunit TctC
MRRARREVAPPDETAKPRAQRLIERREVAKFARIAPGPPQRLMFDSLASALPQVRSGKIRALATTGAERTHNAPDVPTLAESGVPGYRLLAWWALYAGAATPPAVVAKLNRDFGAAMNSEELKGQLAQLGLDPYTTSPEDFVRMQAAELAKWSKLVRNAGIRIEQ